MSIEQEECLRRESIYVNKHEVLRVIKEQFDIINSSLPNRDSFEQNIIGNFVTVIESEIKKEIKQLKEVNI